MAVRLKQSAASRNPDGEIAPGGMDVLRILDEAGPQTVPQIARLRCTSRQNIQILVNRLLQAGCVELGKNAAHKRSPLLHLTEPGREHLAGTSDQEATLLDRLSSAASEAEIGATLELLRRLRQTLGKDWTGQRRKGTTRRAGKPTNKDLPTKKVEQASIAPAEQTAPRGVFEDSDPGEGQLPVNLL